MINVGIQWYKVCVCVCVCVYTPAGCEAGLKLCAVQQRRLQLWCAVQANFPSSPVRKKHTGSSKQHTVTSK